MIKNSLYKYGDDNGRVPAHLNFGKEVYDNMVRNKDRIALIDSGTDERMTYGEMAQMTVDIALSLTRMGVTKGDVVSICSAKRFESLPTMMGIICAGATFSPMDPTYGSYPVIHRLKIIHPKVMFCSLSAYKTHKAAFEEVGSIEQYILYGDEEEEGTLLFKNFLTETTKLEDFEPVPVNGWEDNVLILYSSGTTGLPKGIPVTHLSFLLNSQATTNDESKGKTIYNTREYYLTYGLLYALACLRVAATIVYNPKTGEKEMLEAVQKYKINILQLTPMIVTELIKSPLLDNYDVTSVEYIVCSSTYIREEGVLAIKKRFPNLVTVLQLYGMSEGGSICSGLSDLKGCRAGSSGKPNLGFVIKVVDLETRQPLGPNQPGEICIKGPSVTKGYMNNVCPDCKDEEGFLKTGDVGYYDDDGYFYIVNRIKELIKSDDLSIIPGEYEALLLQIPAVREAAVVGKPHPKHGEVPVAFVALQPGCTATEEELVNYVGNNVRVRLAGVRFVDRLPRTSGDKLDRQSLQESIKKEDNNLIAANK